MADHLVNRVSAVSVVGPARRRGGRLVATMAFVGVLLLSACGGGDPDGSAAPTPTGPAVTTAEETAVPTPSTTVPVPGDVEITMPGSQLSFGDIATVAHEEGRKGGVLELTVDSARQGRLADFAGFALDDPYKKRGNYFYVRVTVANAGKKPFGGVAVPLWGVSGQNTLLQPVQFTSSFKKCPTESLPKRFRPGDEFKTCLVFLSPDKGTLEGVSYRPTEDYVPIEWHGAVDPAPKAKKKAAKNKR